MPPCPRNRIVLASGNAGKLAELKRLFAHCSVDLVAQSLLGIEEAPETGLSFLENAIIKARNACMQAGMPAIADDSGLSVEALDGQPGIYSARYAGAPQSDARNTQKLLDALHQIPGERRAATFICVMVFLRHGADPSPVVGEGHWHGRILVAPRGEGGFGYDPVFEPHRLELSAAELSPERKATLSHRGIAARALLAAMRAQRALPARSTKSANSDQV